MNSIITPIILIAASVGLFWFYTDPAYTAVTGSAVQAEKSIQELQTEQRDYSDALGKTREIEVVRSGLLAKFNNLSESDKDKISKMLPDSIDSVRLIIDVNTIAQKYGMSLSSLLLTASGVLPTASPAPASTPSDFSIGPSSTSGSPYNSVKLGFSVTGSYDNFILFVKELEESLRVVDVTSLSFTTGKNMLGNGQLSQEQSSGSSSDVYTYKMTLRTYYLK